MMLKRRDGADAPENTEGGKQPEKERSGQKYSVFLYVSIMFTVVICIILLSYFVQQRNNSETIETLTEQHTQFSTSALQKIENLQNTNLTLTEKTAEQEETIARLEEELDAAEEKIAGLETAASERDTLQKKYDALADLLRLDAAIAANDRDRAQELRTSLETRRADLGELTVMLDAMIKEME